MHITKVKELRDRVDRWRRLADGTADAQAATAIRAEVARLEETIAQLEASASSALSRPQQ